LLHGSLLLFNSAHFGKARPLVEKRREAMQLSDCAHRVNVYAAIVFVAHPATYTQLVCVVLNESAKADALHSSRYQPAAGFDGRRFQ
jgi:hypothetical protein